MQESLNFLLKGADPVTVDQVTEELKLTSTKLALSWVDDDDAMFAEAFQH